MRMPRRRHLLLAGAAGTAVAGGWWTLLPSGREQAPDVGYVLLDRREQRLSELRGRVVLVNFWATTCSVCLAEMPELVQLHTRLNGRGFETLAVAMSYDPPAAVATYAEQRQLPFAVVIDNTGAVAKAFGDVKATPTHVLIDREGRIVQRWVGRPDFSRVQRLAERLLAGA